MTGPRLVGADIESAAISYLSPLVGVPISTLMPSPRPPSGVRVSATGGSRDLVLDDAQVAIVVWAPDSPAAAALALDVQSWWLAWGESDGLLIVHDAACSRPAYLPDPDTGRPQYVMQASVLTRPLIIDP